MFRFMLSGLFMIALASALPVLTPSPALAQPPATSSTTSPLSLREAARHAAVAPSAASTAASRAPGERRWVQRHPILTGTLVGAGIGGALGAYTCSTPIAEGGSGWCDSYTNSAGMRGAGALYLGAWGAGIGALAGVVANVFVR